jgi:cystathionine beta-lyase/cystathionine gamma-synthase
MHLQLSTVEGHIYSRETAPNATRAEAILSSITGGRALVYGSGLASLFAVYVSTPDPS